MLGGAFCYRSCKKHSMNYNLKGKAFLALCTVLAMVIVALAVAPALVNACLFQSPHPYGDANRDGVVDINDFIDIRAIMLEEKPKLSCSDATLDGDTDVSDYAEVWAMVLEVKTSRDRYSASYDFNTGGTGFLDLGVYKQVGSVPVVRWMDDSDWTAFTSGDYSDVAAVDASDFSMTAEVGLTNALQFRFDVDEKANASALTHLELNATASSAGSTRTLEYYAWNYGLSQWDQIDKDIAMGAAEASCHRASDWGPPSIDSYIDASGYVYIMVILNVPNEDLNIDYVQLLLSDPYDDTALCPVATPTPTASPTATATATATPSPTPTSTILYPYADWDYRMRVEITEESGTGLTDYQVPIEIDPKTFNYDKAAVDGADIRFASSDERTTVDYWIENWNTSGVSTIWVNVSLNASSTSAFFMYYGNASASSASDGQATFEDWGFEDFEAYSVGDLVTVGAWNKHPSNPLPGIDGVGAGYASVFYDSGTYHWYGYYGNVNHATSSDGINWTQDAANNPVLTPSETWEGSSVGVPMTWKEGSTYHMIYRGSSAALGYANSTDGVNWTKYPGNPVMLPGAPGEWDNQGDLDPWGVIKIDSTYYLYYNTVGPAANVGSRCVGLATSTDLINWTKDPNNPLFTGGRFCAFVFKHGEYYYNILPRYTYTTNEAHLELWRDRNPTFYKEDREFVRTAVITGINDPPAWDWQDLDTAVVLTDDVHRDTYNVTNGTLWSYYTGDADSSPRDIETGLAYEANLTDALQVVYAPAWDDIITQNAETGIVSSPARGGSRAMDLDDASGSDELMVFTLSFSTEDPPTTGIAGAWMRRSTSGTGSYYIELQSGEDNQGQEMAGAAGFGPTYFRYWDGSYHDTSVTYSANTWYLVTMEFDAASDDYNFVVYDGSMNEIVRRNGISFGNEVDNVDQVMFHTDAGFNGHGYVDDFRVCQQASAEPTVNLGEEEATYSRTDYFGGTAGIETLTNTKVVDGGVLLGSGAGGAVYDYVGVTVAGGPHDAFECDVDDWTSAPVGGNLNSKTEANQGDYDDIESSDDSRWNTIDPGYNDEVFVWLDMAIDEPESSITNISVHFEGQPTTTDGPWQFQMWIYNDTSGLWEKLGTTKQWGNGVDNTLTRYQNSNCADYISAGGMLTWGFSCEDTTDDIAIDYVKAEIEYTGASGYNWSGQLTSTNVSWGSIGGWGTFYADHSIPAGTDIDYRVLKASDGSTLCSINAAQAAAGYGISGCAAGESSIKLYANLSTANISLTPCLQTWNVTRGISGPTPTPTPSSSPTATATATATPSPSSTPTATATATTTGTATATATATATPSATPTLSSTPEPTPTATSTASATATASPTATASATATATATTGATPTPTSTATATAIPPYATWKYRMRVEITEESGPGLTDYQVPVTLDPKTFDYSKTAVGGADIRFATSDERTTVDYWIENWNTSGVSTIWVNVSLNASSTSTFFMYYGNASAGSAGDGLATFEDWGFDDFEDYSVGDLVTVGVWNTSASNPLPGLDSAGDGYATMFYDNGTYHWYGYYVHVNHATSSDGINWTQDTANNPVLTASEPWEGSNVGVPTTWKEGSIYHMIYRAGSGDTRALGYANSTDGVNWTKYSGNPVISPGGAGEWDNQGGMDPWGVIKINSTYYLFYNTVGGASGIGSRCVGLATSTDLLNWTKDLNNPLFTAGRFCAFAFKHGDYYYNLLPRYTYTTNEAHLELWRDKNPTFYKEDREFVRTAVITGINDPPAWDWQDLDTGCVLTDDVSRDTYNVTNGTLWAYYTGDASGGDIETGLAYEANLTDALQVVYAPAWDDIITQNADTGIVSSPTRGGSRAMDLDDASGSDELRVFTLSFSTEDPPTTGVAGAWMRRSTSGTGSYYMELHSGEDNHGQEMAAGAGFGPTYFRYWDGSYQDTSVTYSANTWYLVTMEFDAVSDDYNFVVYDTGMNEIVRRNGVSFGNTVANIDQVMFHTDAGFNGHGYVDDFRVRQQASTEPTVNLGEEQATYSRTDYFGGTAGIDTLTNTKVVDGDVLLGSGAGGAVYDYVGVTVAGGPHDAFECDVDDWTSAPVGGNLNSKTEANQGDYDDIESSDDSRWNTLDPGYNDEVFVWLDMAIDESESSITNISVHFEGQPRPTITPDPRRFQMWIYNDTSGLWEKLGTTKQWASGTDNTLTRYRNSNCANYISAGGVLTWGFSCEDTSEYIAINYVKAEIEYTGASGYNWSGQLTSTNISWGSIGGWGTFYADHSLPAGTDIDYRVLKASDGSTLCTITAAQAAAGYPISTCAGSNNPIKLYANLSTTNISLTPCLQTWNVTIN